MIASVRSLSRASSPALQAYFRSHFDSMPPRSRFIGADGALHAILCKHATSPWWLKYPEDPKAAIAKETIIAHAELIRELQGLCPT